MNLFHKVGGISIMLAALALGGCAASSTPPRAAPASGDVNTDVTAIHLHDLAGPLLLYYATHRELPRRLAEIDATLLEDGTPAGLDPATKRPLIYTAAGIPVKGMPGRVIVRQAAATSRAGLWVLVVSNETADGKLITYVERLPEARLEPKP